MSTLKTDSPVSRRIARSFIQFLNSVEPSAGVDSEALDVAKECLAEVFKIDQSLMDDQSNCDSLVDIFRSYESNSNPVVDNGGGSDAPISYSQNNAEPHAPISSSRNNAEISKDQDRTTKSHSSGKDELFGKFFGALEKIHYFRRMDDGTDDHSQLERATHSFHNAVEEMQTAGCQTYDQKSLAETFKSQGNKAMLSKHYVEAIELYTFAIALCEDNAVYYCNRAAAYTQIHQYSEAVQDCLRSTQINPNYSKGYSRLGFAYYCQGRYKDAIVKGYMKALQLDPNNESVKENIRVAEQKLKEEQQRGGPGQSSTSTSHGAFSSGGPSSNSTPSSISFNLPANFSSMFMNMGQDFHNGFEELSGAFRPMREMFPGAGAAASNGNQQQDSSNNGRSTSMFMNMGQDFHNRFGELSGAFRSMREMFPGAGAAASNGNQQQDNSNNGRSNAS